MTLFEKLGSAAADYLIKKAANDDNVVHIQQYSPQQKRRNLTDTEQEEIGKAESNWLPTIFQNYGTPLTGAMSSPLKSSLLTALGTTAAGGAIGGLAGKGDLKSSLIGAGIGGLMGIPTGLLSYFNTQSNNDNMKEMMKRLPENATMRDLQSDPAYQKDLDRAAMRNAMMFNHNQNPFKGGVL